MSGLKYANRDGSFNPTMSDQERHHARLDFDKAELAGTDAARAAWFAEWGRRIVDCLWGPAK